ncbi:MAG: ATP-binding protein, partial [Limisphaerales bacterium]
NEICQLQDDGLGNLWVGCDSGIYRLRKSQLRDYMQGRARFLDAVPYGESDGLPTLQCIPGVHVVKSNQHPGPLWFATSRGLVRVRLGLIHWNRLPPPVVLEQVLVDNAAVSLTNPVRVPPGRETIEFRYTALSLVAPEKVRFRCQLVNFDRNWVSMGGKRTARYTQVPPGHYQFRVLACNNDGIWSPTGASVALLVIPFWWETMWFRLVVLVIFGAFVFSLIRQRQVRLREIERLRVRLAGDLHDELGSSLWSINLLSRILQKYGQMGEEERHDISEIHRIARQTSNAIRDIVWIINPSFDTMADLVLRMKDFAGTMLRGLDYRVQCEGVDLSCRLVLDFRQNVFLMFKEAVTNVAKHAQASTVEIRLEERPDVWKLSVRDNGVGFDPSVPGKGNGLQSLRTRAKKIGATISIDSQSGKGTIVMLIIPKS